jgi:hypothetical protein
VFWQVREPLALSIHHLPIAVTFAFLGDGDLLVSLLALFQLLPGVKD